MKKILLAAALLTTAAAPVMANPVHLFSINTTNPQSIDFKGTGTANFNNSTGTNNSFNVGSSTNLGVSGSINATRDYSGVSDGNLQLAGTSVMQQTIGTSGNAANVQAASQAASLAAYTSANQFAKTQTEANFGAAYDVSKVGIEDENTGNITNMSDELYRKADGTILTTKDISGASDWQAAKDEFERAKFDTQYASDYATTLEQSQMIGNWKYDATKTELMALEHAEKGDYKSTYEAYGAYFDQLKEKGELNLLASRSDAVNVSTDAGAETYQKLDEGTWNTRRSNFIDDYALNNKVNQSGVNLSEFVAAQGGSSSSEEEQYGVIMGDFKTVKSTSTGSTGSHQEWIDQARNAADGLLGSNFASRADGTNVVDGGGTTNEGNAIGTQQEWKNEWDKAFAAAYDAKQKDSYYDESTSNVKVTGVGNIANVNASSQSKFNVKLAPREMPSFEAQVAAINGAIIQTDGDGKMTKIGMGEPTGSSGANANGKAGLTDMAIFFPQENGSASGSSGANLSTSSHANQSNSQTASAFIQAFSASQSSTTGTGTGSGTN